jgi:hypothetical protein
LEKPIKLVPMPELFADQIALGYVLIRILLCHNPYLLERPDRVDSAIDFVGFTARVLEAFLKRGERDCSDPLVWKLRRLILKVAPDGGRGDAVSCGDLAKALTLAAVAPDSCLVKFQRIRADVTAPRRARRMPARTRSMIKLRPSSATAPTMKTEIYGFCSARRNFTAFTSILAIAVVNCAASQVPAAGISWNRLPKHQRFIAWPGREVKSRRLRLRIA